MTTLLIPEALQKYTDGERQLELKISNLTDLADCLQAENPELYRVLFNSQGKLCGYANLYLNNQLVSNMLSTPIDLEPNSQLNLIAAVSGG